MNDALLHSTSNEKKWRRERLPSERWTLTLLGCASLQVECWSGGHAALEQYERARRGRLLPFEVKSTPAHLSLLHCGSIRTDNTTVHFQATCQHIRE